MPLDLFSFRIRNAPTRGSPREKGRRRSDGWDGGSMPRWRRLPHARGRPIPIEKNSPSSRRTGRGYATLAVSPRNARACGLHRLDHVFAGLPGAERGAGPHGAVGQAEHPTGEAWAALRGSGPAPMF